MRYPTLWLVILFAVGCAGPPPPHDDGQQLAVVDIPVPSTGQDLGAAYATYRSDTTSVAAQRAYFDAFPQDYATLRKEFGFEEVSEDSTSFGGFYERGDEMIGAFFHLSAIPPADIARKAVGIARKGVWQEDGVGYFQMFLARGFEKNPPIYLAAVGSLPGEEQAGFWSFYLDGPTAYPKEDASTLRRLLSANPRQLALVDSLLALPSKKEH